MRRFLAVIVGAAAAMAFAGPASATTNPAADITVGCRDGRAVATFTYAGFSPRWHLTAEQSLSAGGYGVGNTYQFDGPSGADTISLRLLTRRGPTVVSAHTAVYGGGGRLKAEASATITCAKPPPPPPPPARYDPHAWAQGPCEDPMYRFWFDNRSSNRPVTFRVHYLNFDLGWTTITRTVARRQLVHTGYHHVGGFSRMTITARGHTLYSRVSAAPGNYRECW